MHAGYFMAVAANQELSRSYCPDGSLHQDNDAPTRLHPQFRVKMSQGVAIAIGFTNFAMQVPQGLQTIRAADQPGCQTTKASIASIRGAL